MCKHQVPVEHQEDNIICRVCRKIRIIAGHQCGGAEESLWDNLTYTLIILHKFRQLLMQSTKPLVYSHEPLYITQADVATFILQYRSKIPLIEGKHPLCMCPFIWTCLPLSHVFLTPRQNPSDGITQTMLNWHMLLYRYLHINRRTI